MLSKMLLKLQKEIQAVTGSNVDYITPAVLRRIQSRSFWKDYLGSASAPGLVTKAAILAKDITKTSLMKGKVRSLLAEVSKQVLREEDPTKVRQKKAKRRPDLEESVSEVEGLMSDPRMLEVMKGMKSKLGRGKGGYADTLAGER